MSQELIGTGGSTNGTTFVSAEDGALPMKDVKRWSLIGFVLFCLIGLLCVSSTHRPFTIGPGDALISHVGYKPSIEIARAVGLPVFAVVKGVRTPVSYEEAYGYEDETDRVRVVVPVYAGDRFEKRWWHWRYIAAARPLDRNRVL